MSKQTFVLEVWCGASTPIEAERARYNGNKDCKYDFFRYDCKRIKTIEQYLIGYVEQARERGMQWLYPYFFREDGMYQIISTPDGYNSEGIVASGYIKDLVKQ